MECHKCRSARHRLFIETTQGRHWFSARPGTQVPLWPPRRRLELQSLSRCDWPQIALSTAEGTSRSVVITRAPNLLHTMIGAGALIDIYPALYHVPGLFSECHRMISEGNEMAEEHINKRLQEAKVRVYYASKSRLSIYFSSLDIKYSRICEENHSALCCHCCLLLYIIQIYQCSQYVDIQCLFWVQFHWH